MVSSDVSALFKFFGSSILVLISELHVLSFVGKSFIFNLSLIFFPFSFLPLLFIKNS